MKKFQFCLIFTMGCLIAFTSCQKEANIMPDLGGTTIQALVASPPPTGDECFDWFGQSEQFMAFDAALGGNGNFGATAPNRFNRPNLGVVSGNTIANSFKLMGSTGSCNRLWVEVGNRKIPVVKTGGVEVSITFESATVSRRTFKIRLDISTSDALAAGFEVAVLGNHTHEFIPEWNRLCDTLRTGLYRLTFFDQKMEVAYWRNDSIWDGNTRVGYLTPGIASAVNGGAVVTYWHTMVVRQYLAYNRDGSIKEYGFEFSVVKNGITTYYYAPVDLEHGVSVTEWANTPTGARPFTLKLNLSRLPVELTLEGVNQNGRKVTNKPFFNLGCFYVLGINPGC